MQVLYFCVIYRHTKVHSSRSLLTDLFVVWATIIVVVAAIVTLASLTRSVRATSEVFAGVGRRRIEDGAVGQIFCQYFLKLGLQARHKPTRYGYFFSAVCHKVHKRIRTTTSGSSTNTWKSRLVSRHLLPPAAKVGKLIGGPVGPIGCELTNVSGLLPLLNENLPGRSEGDMLPVLKPRTLPSTIQNLLWQYLVTRTIRGATIKWTTELYYTWRIASLTYSCRIGMPCSQ